MKRSPVTLGAELERTTPQDLRFVSITTGNRFAFHIGSQVVALSVEKIPAFDSWGNILELQRQWAVWWRNLDSTISGMTGQNSGAVNGQ